MGEEDQTSPFGERRSHQGQPGPLKTLWGGGEKGMKREVGTGGGKSRSRGAQEGTQRQ